MASHHLTTTKYLRFFGVMNPSDFFSDEELAWIGHWLNGEEEIDHPEVDWANLNYQADAAIDFKKPFVDQFVLARFRERQFVPRNLWPNNSEFAVCLSHDIDRWESYSPKVFMRNLKKRRFHSSTIRAHQKLTLQILKTGIKQRLTRKVSDPLWCYEKWINLENKYARTGTYFIFVRPEKEKDLHPNDCDYTLEDELVYNGEQTQVQSILKLWSKKGIELGLHGSIVTETNTELFGSLRHQLEKTIEQPVYISRQHYLSFKLPETLKVEVANGIKVDSSIGFNKFNGFRLGTSFPVFLNHDNAELLEIPLTIMDSSTFLQRKLSREEAIKEIDQIIDLVKSVNGCLTVNFHPDYVDRAHFFDTYEYLLNVLSKHNCIFMSMSEIKDHLEKRCAE